MVKNKFAEKIGLLFLVFLLFAGQFFSAPAKAGTARKQTIVPDENTSWNFEEGEAVAKINCADCLASISQKYDVSLSLLGEEGNENFYLAKSLTGKSARKLVKTLEKDRQIELVQPNFRYQPLSHTPNDKFFRDQWPLFDTSAADGGVSAPSAWGAETKSQRNVAVAVIDTGVNTGHKDLKKNLTKGSAKGKNFEYPKKNLSDSDGHGTFLAGIIAAQTENKKGIAGASFFNHLRVMSLRFDFTTSQAIIAINYAGSKGVPIVNASWGSYGGEGYDPALKDAISQYPGILVTAAGNEGRDHDSGDPDKKMYPCDFDLANIICVGASDRDGNPASYSDYGAASVDVAAPGGTEDYPLIGLSGSKSGYDEAIGSSLSAAFVSAEAGLLLSKYPALTSAQVIEIIKNSVDANASLAGRVLSGGKVNFLKALENAAGY